MAGVDVISRRRFVRNVTESVVGTAVAMSAKSYAQIVGANERVNFATVGLNSRGSAHVVALKKNETHARVTHLCDCDTRILARALGEATGELGYAPRTEQDFRKVLDAKDVDVVTIATPDHWHAPMAIRALQTGKHVYVEKPSSHNPREGEWLVTAQKRYGKLVQVGNQQRSSPHTIEMVKKIHEGLVGRAYFAKCWYADPRESMGHGKQVPVPANLDWELWQGPAPRRPYVDNVHPYNWHWLRIYGTGEALNNGTHEIDVARWALGVDYPDRVSAAGGRYAFQDDWQFPDTMVANFEYPNKMITWEDMSANGKQYYKRGRGTTIHGETGTVLIDREGWEQYDLKDKLVDSYTVPGAKSAAVDLLSRDAMTNYHFANMIAAIRVGEALHSPISIANVSVTLMQLANIAWWSRRELNLDPATAHIVGDAEAMKSWDREYAPGWAPTS